VIDDNHGDRPEPATVTPLRADRRDSRVRRRPRVLLITEGTYPYSIGGVSSWCDLLLRNLTEIDWQVLPVIAAHGKPPVYQLPPHARQVGRIELWTEEIPHGRFNRRDRDAAGQSLPDRLVRGLIAWDADLEALTDALVWCRANPVGVRRAFRSGRIDARRTNSIRAWRRARSRRRPRSGWGSREISSCSWSSKTCGNTGRFRRGLGRRAPKATRSPKCRTREVDPCRRF
jgi:hypothetical protein